MPSGGSTGKPPGADRSHTTTAQSPRDAGIAETHSSDTFHAKIDRYDLPSRLLMRLGAYPFTPFHVLSEACAPTGLFMARGLYAIASCTTDTLHWFNGILAHVEAGEDTHVFASKLAKSLTLWKSQGRRGVWLRIPAQSPELIPPAVQAGFSFHHAEKSHVMMTLWLPDTSVDPNKLPANASHFVGVSAVVFTPDREKVLLVQERYGLDSTPRWKTPGGLVDAGEELEDAAVREVWEETGIKSTFESVVAFRHNAKFFMGKGDVHAVMRLRPETFDIKIDKDELLAADWIPVRTYLNDTVASQHMRDIVRLAAEHPELDLQSKRISATFNQHTFTWRMYHNALKPRSASMVPVMGAAAVAAGAVWMWNQCTSTRK